MVNIWLAELALCVRNACLRQQDGIYEYPKQAESFRSPSQASRDVKFVLCNMHLCIWKRVTLRVFRSKTAVLNKSWSGCTSIPENQK